ncbi:protein serine/threonine kinase, putative [Entamoeba invadens IP1]|uniref:Protein serine/threonine kinase, putative n=1 Tax=Entamoeba invadens IP1 TaxID=370355 RepID=L7FKZ4_ENTIV|nr:protein serine/threonine kinase, putative [Entamoeba invadens IP1]ELP87175.1 protein serine/threonine kinase, putative [Entamoeba invadens IP1]|eukprot:XP_004253946.1 protein serine/threonine kinase, putative [Entamoeba invadens IP1]
MCLKCIFNIFFKYYKNGRTRAGINFLASDAAKGISYLHDNVILHRDIKPDYILVNNNLLMTNMTFTKCVGTPKYMAPEVLNKKKYTKSADVYSFGVSLFECAIWKDPYLDKQFKFAWDIVDCVVSGKRLKRPSYLNEDIYNIVDDMWCQDVHKRINVRDVILKLESINI